jgi:hypothetical protein
MPGPSLTGLKGTQIMGSISYTLVKDRSLAELAPSYEVAAAYLV